MKYICNYLYVFVFILSMSRIDARVPAPKKAAHHAVTKNTKKLYIRVLLASDPLDQSAHFSLICPAGFSVVTSNPLNPYTSELPEVHIAQDQGLITINGRRVKNSGTIKPNHQEFVFQGRTYHGALEIMKHNKKILLINIVPLEEYVSSVVRTESWPGWPLEVNKAFAIASRSYVLAMMLRAKKTKKPYHVKNTNAHQTYQGLHASQITKEAVAQTQGIFLSYEHQPIIAMFDCCCGGIIPAHIDGVDFTRAPYLARNYVCHHCKQCKIYQWRTECDQEKLKNILEKYVPKDRSVRDISITKKDKAGVVHEIAIVDNKKVTHTLTSQQFCSLLKEAKSPCFTISKNKGNTVIAGRGYGHHLGICQWGAREMIRDGWNYQQVLKFYYPGAEFARV